MRTEVLALAWYAAGTVYLDKQTNAGDGVQGFEVVLTDAHGRTIRLETNGAGSGRSVFE